MLSNCGAGKDSWESLGLQGDPTHPSERRSVLGVYRKDWCWSWNYNTLATWCEELIHWKRRWCWERLKAGEGDDRGDGWMASPTHWTCVWVNSGSWRWTGRPGVLQSMGSQGVIHDWAVELNWTDVGQRWAQNWVLKVLYCAVKAGRISQSQVSEGNQDCACSCCDSRVLNVTNRYSNCLHRMQNPVARA